VHVCGAAEENISMAIPVDRNRDEHYSPDPWGDSPENVALGTSKGWTIQQGPRISRH
jgi:hypothetical protein